MYCAGQEQGSFTAYTSGHLGLVRLINISNKFFEKILGEWTIFEAEKPVIKFGEKGKHKQKTGKVVKPCSCKRKTFALRKKNCKVWFLFYRIMPFY